MAQKKNRKKTKKTTARSTSKKAPSAKATGRKASSKKASGKKASGKKAASKKTAGKKTAGTRTGVATSAEIGADLVALCNVGRGDDVVGRWYHPKLVSVEGDGTTTKGLRALAGKYAWWEANHEVHSVHATGPFVGHTGFAVRFDLVVTPKGGQRTEMSEIAVYTVRDGKIVREEFMYGA